MKKHNDIKKDLKKLKANKQFLSIMILFFIAIFFWIIITLITSQSKTEVSKELTIIAKPLTPHLDIETLKKIEAKKSFSNKDLNNFTIYKSLTTRDGKTEKIVPIEVNIDDIDPKPTVKPNSKSSELNSLLIPDIASDTAVTN